MTEKQAHFKAMTEGTAEDWQLIAEHMRPFMGELPARLISHLKLPRGQAGALPADGHPGSS